MVKIVSMNASMENTNNYSSPVPLVGLYIAAASSVCLFLMLCDVWAGFKSKKLWFPCRFFSVNSVTLTLISVAAKLPVDLTTAMPSKQDQLSKISGTVFICTTMSFMLPSIAVNGEFEAYANVTALSIFVITVVVNICIQIATGVICSFISEHIIVLVCMLFLLVRFWTTATAMNGLKGNYNDKSKAFLRNGGESLLARLRICYVFGYHSCLQLFAYSAPYLADVALVCMTCSIVFLQAVVRSVALKESRFRNGVSDYGWSMWFVIVSQILSVAVVSLVMGSRFLNNIFHPPSRRTMHRVPPYLQFEYLFSLGRIPKFVENSFRFVIYYPLFLVNLFVAIFNLIVQYIIVFVSVLCCCLCVNFDFEDKGDEKLEEFENLVLSSGEVVQNWLLRKGVADMQRWMMINKQGCPQHLTKLLTRVHPSEESPYTVGSDQGIKISSLSIVLLVEIAKVVRRPTCLTNVSSEIFEIIHFIQTKVNVSSFKDRSHSIMARAIYQYGLISGISGLELSHDWDSDADRTKRHVSFGFLLKNGWAAFVTNDWDSLQHIDQATYFIGSFINDRSSDEDVYARIEQLFVDMLHAFLAQLPVAVYTHILESPDEEYHERVRLTTRKMVFCHNLLQQP